MKIYIIPVQNEFQPMAQKFIYPKHNIDYGVEQDFLIYLNKNPSLLTGSPEMADWYYLPIYWTRWHLNHDYGKLGLEILQKAVKLALINSKKTFTVCQYDDGILVEDNDIIQMLSSRKGKSGIDIPLLSSKLPQPWLPVKKKYIASFVGRVSTHPTRQELMNVCKHDSRILFRDVTLDVRAYVKTILESYVTLCPRGYGGSSFRFYESMSLGVVPLLIGEDIRPFKRSIDWDSCSIYCKNPSDVHAALSVHSKLDLIKMGQAAKNEYESKLQYQNWCNLALKELKYLYD